VLLQKLTAQALKRTEKLPAKSFRIHKIVMGASYSTMRDQQTVFQNLFPCTVYLPGAYGFAYAEGIIDEAAIRSVMNRDVRDVLQDATITTPLRIALLDALYATYNDKAVDGHLVGDLDERAASRADLLLDGMSASAEIVLLGPASEIIEGAVKRGIRIRVTDRSDQKVGRSYYGITVEKAAPLAKIIQKYPKTTHIIATGMIFISDTAEEIFEVTKEHDLHLTLYMETGAWLAPELLTYGANRIIAEEFPFYDFRGPTPYRIYT